MAVKWSNDSAFPEGNQAQIGDRVMGLRSGQNYKFDFPSDGIKDGDGNFLLKWETVGGNAVNYLQFTNSNSGVGLIIESDGDDTDIDIDINTKGAGVVNINAEVDGVLKLDVDNIEIDGNTISTTNLNGDLNLSPNGTGLIDLDSDIVLVGQDIQHKGDTNNKIVFGTDTQDFETGGSSRLDISDSGVRLGGANSRVTAILDEDDMVSDSDTALATQQSIKAYVDNNGATPGGSDTQIQYNNAGAFGGDSGFTTDGAGSVTITGDLSVDNLNINGNSITSTDTNGDIDLSPDGTGIVTVDSTGRVVVTDTTGVTGADRVINIMSLTTAEYNAITPDSSTLYVITDA